MSGTSLDGLDMALCEFRVSHDKYSFKLLAAKTIGYNAAWQETLKKTPILGAEKYFELHARYGRFLAGEVNKFLKGKRQKPLAISSHGHTVFHQPGLGFSTQIGCGATIAALTAVTTVCDFRSLDTALGGQGAPLVPVGDRLLFGAYDACLNIGGIANVSYNGKNGARKAYDVCEANMLLNYLAEKAGKRYDSNGALARSGKINENLLKQLNSIDYYKKTGSKSIGREWFEQNIRELIDASSLGVSDLLATATEHIAHVLGAELNNKKLKTALLSGGGTFNNFLVEKIQVKTKCKLVVPEPDIINFKEAIIFAFLGFLRLREQSNTFRSVTGASRDSIGGAVYHG